jgi:hypothetical protein
MGNALNKYNDSVISLSETAEKDIRENYKVIDVSWLDSSEAKWRMFGDEFFQKNLKKEEVVNEIVDFYLNHKDNSVYKKTDYLCNEQEKICICNTNAEEFRKIYDVYDYTPGDKYISWIKKSNEPF